MKLVIKIKKCKKVLLVKAINTCLMAGILNERNK